MKPRNIWLGLATVTFGCAFISGDELVIALGFLWVALFGIEIACERMGHY